METMKFIYLFFMAVLLTPFAFGENPVESMRQGLDSFMSFGGTYSTFLHDLESKLWGKPTAKTTANIQRSSEATPTIRPPNNMDVLPFINDKPIVATTTRKSIFDDIGILPSTNDPAIIEAATRRPIIKDIDILKFTNHPAIAASDIDNDPAIAASITRQPIINEEDIVPYTSDESTVAPTSRKSTIKPPKPNPNRVKDKPNGILTTRKSTTTTLRPKPDTKDKPIGVSTTEKSNPTTFKPKRKTTDKPTVISKVRETKPIKIFILPYKKANNKQGPDLDPDILDYVVENS
ncbi:uncharacterized protein LOC142223512 isoform X1 [Haematobia irritans]|uniref:uncharacterized protein LOC142223512 isoform X1 n=1 Tax=Haematobia irritans TaxID=7368 RepID=UPI003F507376